ncbi:hypothetical protein [Polynucleobacter sp. IMCC 29146]|uniref:hypothetical protein n=1 Tax=Polynucleobacter sp. IMCC 29146 TaxID=2780953 RepID=UPI001F323713|nr:hypothetical protein [Polynucleobacter sp. IMCC 29146]MCE7530303.1 hypothetical protein [Polynucleobacter sp. IMCC 29146]
MKTNQTEIDVSKIEIDWGQSHLIPAGEYQAVYVTHEATNGSFGPKLKVIFRIVTQGPYFETLIPAWYNIKDGSTGKRCGGGCTKFCVNGLIMGKSPLHRSNDDDRSSKTSSTPRTH